MRIIYDLPPKGLPVAMTKTTQKMEGRMKNKTWAFVACSMMATAMFYAPSEAATEITINNPYATVDWATFG